MNTGQSLLSGKRNSSPAFIPDLIFNMVRGCRDVSSPADDKIKQRTFASQESANSDKSLLLLHAETITRRSNEKLVEQNTRDSMNWRSNGKIFLNIYIYS